MSQPISTAVEERINRELMSLKASGISIPAQLKSLFNAIAAYRDLESPMESGFAWSPENSSGLDFAVTAGRYHTGRGALHIVAADVVTLADDDLNYVYLDVTDDSLGTNTTGFVQDQLPLFEVTTAGGEITNVLRVLPRLMVVHGGVLGFNQLRPSLVLGSSEDVIPPIAVAWEITDEASDTREAVFTIHHGDESALIGNRIVEVFLADSPGGWLTSTAASVGIYTDVNRQVEELDAGKRLRVKILSGESYFASVTIEHSGAKTWYVGLIVGDQIFYSPPVAFV